MRTAALRARIGRRERVVGTFLKIPEVTVVEVMAQAGLDFLCLDAEHSAWDRGRMDACLAVARAVDMPVLVRVSCAAPQDILQALDAGAVGVVVPHVTTAAMAADMVRASHFGAGGRGYAGSTRWAGFATRSMADVLDQDAQTIVIAQIEDPEALDHVEAIAAVPGIDAIFAGPADLSVGLGQRDMSSPQLRAALERIGEAAQAAGKSAAAWVPNPGTGSDWAAMGFNLFVVGSDHTFMRAGAAAAMAALARPD